MNRGSPRIGSSTGSARRFSTSSRRQSTRASEAKAESLWPVCAYTFAMSIAFARVVPLRARRWMMICAQQGHENVRSQHGRAVDARPIDPSSYGWRVARDADGSAGLYLTSSDDEEAGPFTPR